MVPNLDLLLLSLLHGSIISCILVVAFSLLFLCLMLAAFAVLLTIVTLDAIDAMDSASPLVTALVANLKLGLAVVSWAVMSWGMAAVVAVYSSLKSTTWEVKEWGRRRLSTTVADDVVAKEQRLE